MSAESDTCRPLQYRSEQIDSTSPFFLGGWRSSSL